MLQCVATTRRPGPLFPRLLGDVGGTNARFAWQPHAGAAIEQVEILPCAQYPSLADAVQAYLGSSRQANLQTGSRGRPACAAIGIATPVLGDWLAMTNHPWAFSVSALRSQLGLERLLVLNDFTALALALPHLDEQAKRPIGGGAPVSGGNIGLLGPGTGLGVSGLIHAASAGVLLPIAGEGGHVTLAASNALEFAVLETLQARYGHVSAERVLSGGGLVNLYGALAQLRGLPIEHLIPAQVMQRAAGTQAGGDRDPIAVEALDLFCGFLGQVAGDLALTLGARGGVYIGGGIVPRMGRLFDRSPFRARFEAKGHYSAYLQSIPVWLIDSPVPAALLGAAQALSLPESMLTAV
jgi:glucokinase